MKLCGIQYLEVPLTVQGESSGALEASPEAHDKQGEPNVVDNVESRSRRTSIFLLFFCLEEN